MKRIILAIALLICAVFQVYQIQCIPVIDAWRNPDTIYITFDPNIPTAASAYPLHISVGIPSSSQGQYGHIAPEPSLKYMNTHQLAEYFYTHRCTQEEILDYPLLYLNPAYLAIAKQLPQYPAFVEKYYHLTQKGHLLTAYPIFEGKL